MLKIYSFKGVTFKVLRFTLFCKSVYTYYVPLPKTLEEEKVRKDFFK